MSKPDSSSPDYATANARIAKDILRRSLEWSFISLGVLAAVEVTFGPASKYNLGMITIAAASTVKAMFATHKARDQKMWPQSWYTGLLCILSGILIYLAWGFYAADICG